MKNKKLIALLGMGLVIGTVFLTSSFENSTSFHGYFPVRNLFGKKPVIQVDSNNTTLKPQNQSATYGLSVNQQNVYGTNGYVAAPNGNPLTTTSQGGLNVPDQSSPGEPGSPLIPNTVPTPPGPNPFLPAPDPGTPTTPTPTPGTPTPTTPTPTPGTPTPTTPTPTPGTPTPTTPTPTPGTPTPTTPPSTPTSSANLYKGICLVRTQITNVPLFTAPDFGNGYAKKNKGSNFTSYLQVDDACTQTDYAALAQLFCLKNPKALYVRQVGLYRQDLTLYGVAPSKYGTTMMQCS